MQPLALLFSLAVATTIKASPPQHGKGTWTNLPSIPFFPRQEHTTVHLPTTESIYILGGITSYNPNATSDPTTSLVQRFHLPSSTWHNVTSLPKPMNHINTASVNGKIYVLGGLVPSPTGFPWEAAADCFVYDPSSDSWELLPNMPDGRGSAAMGVKGGVIYLSGGLSELGAVQGTLDTVSSYDTDSGNWTSLPSLPAPRDHAGGALIDDTYFVLGGRAFGQFNTSDVVFALDLCDVGSGWIMRSGKMPTPRGGVAAGTIGDKVYVFGGEGNPAEGSEGVFNQTEVYDVETDSWEKLEPMVVPRHGTSAVGVDGVVYIPGGGVKVSGAPVDVFNAFKP